MIEIDENERILRTVRKHWFVLLGDLFTLITLVALPILALFIFNIVPIDKLLHFTGDKIYAGAFFFFGWLLFVWILGWNMWTDYYLDVLIITDRRIFDITQNGLFRRESSSFRIDNIQNATVDQKGIIQTLLKFGTIRLETAGEREDFIATYITNPYEVKKFINDMQDKEMERSKLVHFDRPVHGTNATPTQIPHAEKLTRTDSDGL